MPCEDAPCCGCCDFDAVASPELADEMDLATLDGDEPFDGFLTDGEADGDALASAGHGMDEDYGYCEGFDEGEW